MSTKIANLPVLNVPDIKNDILVIDDASEPDTSIKTKQTTSNAILKAAGLAIDINIIGTAGEAGFGVGVCPPSLLPDYVETLSGTYTKTNDNYGNYKVTTDGSIIVWIPAFWFKYNSDNTVDVKRYSAFTSVANAVASGYQIHRMFIDGGNIKEGVFVDKYDWSLTNFQDGVSGMPSSIKNGNPISSNSDTKRIINGTNDTFAGSFSNCISNSQSPSDNYGGAWAAAKARGNDFSVWSIFVAKGLALLSLAHGQAASSVTNCAWYDATDNFPKGNNNNGADIDDATVTFTQCDDGYWNGRNEARKCGSGSTFAKTTHNGQNSGVADLNGNQWKILSGMTAIITNNDITNLQATDGDTRVQITTTSAHNLQVGDQFGIEDGTELDGIFTVTDVIDTTNIKIANTTTTFSQPYGTVYSGTFYLNSESVTLKDVTGGNSNSTSDQFDDTWIGNNMDAISVAFKDGSNVMKYGDSTNQVLPFDTDRTTDAYKKACASLPKDANSVSSGGSNLFGQDYYYQYYRDELVPRSGGRWVYGTIAGVWYLYLSNHRASSRRSTSARSCLYV